MNISTTYDVIAIGSGHNGLIAAGYLAKAGKSVLVIESQPWLGGGVVTRELTAPGFWHDQHSTAHIFIQANPVLAKDELGLKSRYGLEYIYPDPPHISVFEDGETLALYTDRSKNYKAIEYFSKADAESFLKLAELGDRILPMLLSGLYSPPIPNGAMSAMLDQSREGREILMIMQKSALDIITEYFESDYVRVHFLKLVTENLQLPDEMGTGIGLFMFVAFLERYGIGVAKGGSGALTEALVAQIRDHGGTILKETRVEKVLVKGDRAVGVRTSKGEFFAKDCLIGALHPHRLHSYIDNLDPYVDKAARKTRPAAFSAFVVHGALKEPAKFSAGDHVNGTIITELLPTRLEQLRRSFDELRYGVLPERPLFGANCPSNVDPSRAPVGNATFLMFSYAPYDLRDGGAARWDGYKEDYADWLCDKAGKFITNLGRDNFIARSVYSPLDLERDSESFQKGDIHGIAPYSYQFGSHRPTPDLGSLTVPGIERLFLVGPFMHPGGGVFGAGRAAAMKAFEAMGLDFDKVSAA
nr:NAD(P)/FAD-dependent oxidoreductase [Rhizobium sp. SG570]